MSLAAEPLGAFAQAGPDLFGLEPDELILPSEPVPTPDPEMEIDLDEMSEIPIDPDEDSDDDPDADALVGPGAGADGLIGGASPTVPEPGETLVPEPAEALVPEPAAFAPEDAASAFLPPSAPHRAPQRNRPDAPLALYRRYRPDTFAEVIGQEHVTDPLQRALTNNKVSHAYLFSGPRGCGKTTSARILARCLNCEQGPTPNPCGVCQSCRDLARGGGGSIDVIEIDAASHGGVDEARDLRERAFFAPVHSRYKIYIIDEAHMVTNAGFNALLKVVEEPPAHVKFIFATTEPEKVIGTIRSRTHHYPFRLVPPRTLTSYLAQLCEAEGVSVDPSVLPLVVRAGAGSVRDSLSVLDQLLGGADAGGVSYRHATRLLGYTPDSLLDEVMDAFAAGDAQAVFACIDKVVEVGQDPRRFGEDLLRRLRDLIIVAAVPDALTSGLVDVAADQAERLSTQASAMGAGELTRAAEVIAKGLTDMRGTTAPRLHLELMCARVLLPGADVDDRGVHARLDRIERRLQMVVGTGPSAPSPDRIEPAGPDAPPAPDRPRATRPAPRPVPEQAPMPDRPDAQRPEPRPVPEQAFGQRPSDTPSPASGDLPAERRSVAPQEPPAGRPGETGQYPAGREQEAAPARPPVADPWAQPWPDAPAGASPAPAASAARPEPSGGAPRPEASARPSQPERQQAAPRATSQPTERQARAASDPSVLSTAQLRAEWPSVLERIKGRRRVTWIVVRENAVVHDYAGDVLTLAFNNPGARESFARGGHDAILREVLREAFGVAATVRAIDNAEAAPVVATPAFDAPPAPAAASRPGEPPAPRRFGDDPGWGDPYAGQSAAMPPEDPYAPAPSGTRPDAGCGPAPAPHAEGSAEAARAIARARANVQPTQIGVGDDEDEAGESLDDVDLDQGVVNVDELLIKHLGAELIGEEEPER
ncbi:MAG: DNA polymerase III subunit gamma and tau [Propioniciclava sp.]|uniref:DNA polymerase III subunit gamma and tau n=1 Tax=Propioniciclava sp. TaxID=2038686 RepID=UPI0039E60339